MKRAALAARIAVASIVIAGVVWLLRNTDVHEIGDALSQCRVWPIAVAAVINFGIIVCKAFAWRFLLAPAHTVRATRLVRYTLIACAASVIVPLRAGELVRLWLLRDRDAVPVSRGAAVALTEKLLDVVSMMLLVVPLPLLMRQIPSTLSHWIVGLSVGAIAGLCGLYVVASRVPSHGRWQQLAQAISVIRDLRRCGSALGVLCVAWLIDLGMVYLVLYGLGIAIPVAACVLVLFAINVAIAFPSTPGHVGAFELGAVLGLRLVGVAEAPALAFAVVYHSLQIVPVLAVGLVVGAPEIVRRTF